MIDRSLYRVLAERIGEEPAVVLLGSRQSGKSTLARWLLEKRENGLYLDLERPSDNRKLADAEAYLERVAGSLVCLDEVQRAPEVFATLRSLIDEDRRPGRFLLLGSASQELLKQASESLAGRVSFLELTPLNVSEVGIENLDRVWLRGGYPPSYLAKTDERSLDWRIDFVGTFLERDLPQLGFNYPSENMRRFWTMCAHLHGQAFNGSRLGSSLGVSHHTARSYGELLAQTFVLRLLQPLEANVKKRLVKTPKLYVRDTGLLHALLSIESMDELFGHPVFGASWEGFVIESIIPRLKSAVRSSFYRSATGDEIDLVLDKGGKRIAIECKASKSPELTKANVRAAESIAPTAAFVVAPIKDRYAISKGWEAVGIGAMLGELAEQGWLLY